MRSNQRQSTVSPHCVEITLPVEFTSQTANLRLLSQTDQGSQTQLDGRTLAL
jgi:hypothetical protein